MLRMTEIRRDYYDLEAAEDIPVNIFKLKLIKLRDLA